MLSPRRGSWERSHARLSYGEGEQRPEEAPRQRGPAHRPAPSACRAHPPSPAGSPGRFRCLGHRLGLAGFAGRPASGLALQSGHGRTFAEPTGRRAGDAGTAAGARGQTLGEFQNRYVSRSLFIVRNHHSGPDAEKGSRLRQTWGEGGPVGGAPAARPSERPRAAPSGYVGAAEGRAAPHFRFRSASVRGSPLLSWAPWRRAAGFLLRTESFLVAGA